MVKLFLQNRWLSQTKKYCKILFVTICLIHNSIGYCQNYFNRTYHYLTSDSLNRTESYGGLVEVPQGGYLASGNSWNSINGSTKLILDRINSDGELISQKAYGDSGDYFIVSDMKTLQDGNIGILISKSSYLLDSTWFYFVKSTTEGDTILTRVFSSGKLKTNARKFCLTSDNGVALVGWTGEAQNSHGKSCVIKLDSLYNIQWVKDYGDSTRFNVGTSIVQLNSNGYFVTSWFSEGSSNTYIRNSRLSRIDEYGNELWTADYGLPGLLDNIEEILICNPNSFAMIGSRCLGPDYLDNANGWFMLVDSSGNEIINKNYGSPFLEGLNRFVRINNDFLAVGVQQLPPISRSTGYLMKLNSTGDSIWSRSYRFDSSQTNYGDNTLGLSMTSDSGIILYGHVRIGSTGTQDAWLVKVDSNGCEDLACSQLVSVFENFQTQNNNCFLYPNPSYGSSNLQLGEEFIYQQIVVTIYDLNGAVINRDYIMPDDKKFVIPLRKVDTGLYFISIKSGIKEQTLKWVVVD